MMSTVTLKSNSTLGRFSDSGFMTVFLVVTSKSKLFTAACHTIILRHGQFQIFNFYLRALKCRSKYFDFKIVAEEMTRQKN